MIMLLIAALLPAIVLCVYVFSKDRVEKEPVSFLLKLLCFGVICVIPVLFFGSIIGDTIDSFFASETVEAIEKGIKVPEFYTYNFLYYFFAVALVEEGMKFCALIFATGKSKEYNSYFDGLIYAVFVSLGFAAFENVLYVFEGGFYTAFLRAVLSVPGHMFFGVMMGYQYSMWHLTKKAEILEKVLIEEGDIHTPKPLFSSGKFMIKSLMVPTLAHGFYDFCCSADSFFAMLVLYGFVIFMYIHCFKKIRKMSKADAREMDFVKYMLISKYPYLSEKFYSGE